MSGDNGRLDRLRQGQAEVTNHVIDEFAAGRISRRDFLRRGSVVGISVPVLAASVAACENSSTPAPRPSSPSPVAHKAGATITAGILTPTGGINPLTVADVGGGIMLAQTGEYLCLANQQLGLQPMLAESWTPNSAADVWTFKIRQGVTFHDGRPLTADDVVYTYKLQTNPNNSANALSAFGGVLGPSGVTKVDDHTVAFHLEAPNGNFPYLTCSENYNMIILPDGYDPAYWQRSFVGTGPFMLKSYTPAVERVVQPQRAVLGAQGPARRHRVHLLRHPGAADPRAQQRHGRRHRAVRGIRRRATASPRRPVQHHQAALQRASRTVDAL